MGKKKSLYFPSFLRWDTRVLSHTFCLLFKHIQHVTLKRSPPPPPKLDVENILLVLTLPRTRERVYIWLLSSIKKKITFLLFIFLPAKNNAMTITINWVLFKRNSFYGDIQLQGKSNTHPSTFIMRSLRVRVAKPLASLRTCSWWVKGWVSPNQFCSVPPALAVTLCYQGLNSWS